MAASVRFFAKYENLPRDFLEDYFFKHMEMTCGSSFQIMVPNMAEHRHQDNDKAYIKMIQNIIPSGYLQ